MLLAVRGADLVGSGSSSPDRRPACASSVASTGRHGGDVVRGPTVTDVATPTALLRPRTDPFRGVPEGPQAARLADEQRVPELLDLLGGLGPSALSAVLEVLRQRLRSKDVLPHALDAEDPLADLVLGAVLQDEAYDQRGTSQIQDVDPGGFAAFRARTGAARHVLERARRGDPDEPQVLVHLLQCETASSDRGARLRDLVRELRRDAPGHVAGHVAACYFLGRRWFGGVGEADALAVEVGRDLAPGHVLHGLGAPVLWERWTWHAHFSDGGGPDAAGALMADPTTHRLLETLHERSVGHPDHRPGPWTVHVRSHLAHLAWAARQDDLAREQLRALDGWYDEAALSAETYDRVRHDLLGDGQQQARPARRGWWSR